MTVLRNIGQLATCAPGRPQGDAGLVDEAAVVIENGRVTYAGPEAGLPDVSPLAPVIDCGGRLVIPGLVDCHTHLVFGGWRAAEFEQRIRGSRYQDIAAAGGGIASTVSATRSASREDLEARARSALDGMLALGVTTVECKSGYGLDSQTELRVLELYAALDETQPVDLVPTYLGAHVVPRDYENRRDDYLALVIDDMLPEISERGLAQFVDVFVDAGAFSPAEARRVLLHAQALGLGVKVHADQLADDGAAKLAAELGAVSAEHLEYADDEGIKALAASKTVAVSLPLASLYLGERYLPARRFIETGVDVAVATDFNPGSAPSWHLPFAMTLACLNQRMSPAEALTGATRIAARAIGRDDVAGSLVPGRPADLAVIDAPNLSHWLYQLRPNACLGVAKAGHWVRPLDPTRLFLPAGLAV